MRTPEAKTEFGRYLFLCLFAAIPVGFLAWLGPDFMPDGDPNELYRAMVLTVWRGIWAVVSLIGGMLAIKIVLKTDLVAEVHKSNLAAGIAILGLSLAIAWCLASS